MRLRQGLRRKSQKSVTPRVFEAPLRWCIRIRQHISGASSDAVRQWDEGWGMAGVTASTGTGKENSMQTGKEVASKMRARRLGVISAAALATTLGMLALGGCSSENADKPTTPPVAVNFQLEK